MEVDLDKIDGTAASGKAWRYVLNRNVAIAVIVAFALGCAAMLIALRAQPQTLSECVIEQMRGVPGNLSGTVLAVCQKRHPGETLE